MQQPWPKPLLCGIGAYVVTSYRPSGSRPTKTIWLLTSVLVLVLTPFARGQFTIPDGYQNPTNLQIANGNLYFTATSTYSNDTLMSVPSSGGPATPVVAGLTNFDGGFRGINAYSVDGPQVYGGYGGYGTYTNFSAPSSGGSSTSLASIVGGTFIGESAGTVYYSNNFNNINAIPASGGTPTTLATGVWVRYNTMDSSGIYFQNYNDKNIYNFNLTSHSVTPIATGLSQEVSIFSDANNVYLNDFGNGIIAVPKAGGAPHVVVSGSNIRGYAASAGYVYYTNGSSVNRITAKGGSTPLSLGTTASGTVTGIATDGKAVYYTAAGTNGGDKVNKIQPAVLPSTEEIAFYANTHSYIGHAFVQLIPFEGSQAGQSLYYGFYPEYQSNMACPGQIQNDQHTPWTWRITYDVSDVQYAAAAALIRHDIAHPPYYFVPTFNCTNWVSQVAAAANIQLPNIFTGVHIADPYAFASSLADIGNGNLFKGGVVMANPNQSGSVILRAASSTASPVDYSFSQLELAGHSDPSGLATALGLPLDQINLGTVNANRLSGLNLSLLGTDPNSAILSMSWGDGLPDDTQATRFAHLYDPGTYNADLFILDSGAVHSYDMTVVVSDGAAATITVQPSAFTPSLSANIGEAPIVPQDVPEPAIGGLLLVIVLPVLRRR